MPDCATTVVPCMSANVVALVVDQVSVDADPAVTVVGFALKELMTGAAGGGGGGVVVAVPSVSEYWSTFNVPTARITCWMRT